MAAWNRAGGAPLCRRYSKGDLPHGGISGTNLYIAQARCGESRREYREAPPALAVMDREQRSSPKTTAGKMGTHPGRFAIDLCWLLQLLACARLVDAAFRFLIACRRYSFSAAIALSLHQLARC